MDHSNEASRVDLWNHKYSHYKGRRKLYGDPTTAKMAAEFLGVGDVRVVEDWGCGFGGFERLVKEHQTYVGVDGSDSPFANVKADLTKYRSTVDGILLRHVLDHNLEWKAILQNALSSFTKRLVIVQFTPFTDKTGPIGKHASSVSGIPIYDIAFCKDELLELFPQSVIWKLESVATKSAFKQEHVFYLHKD